MQGSALCIAMPLSFNLATFGALPIKHHNALRTCACAADRAVAHLVQSESKLQQDDKLQHQEDGCQDSGDLEVHTKDWPLECEHADDHQHDPGYYLDSEEACNPTGNVHNICEASPKRMRKLPRSCALHNANICSVGLFGFNVLQHASSSCDTPIPLSCARHGAARCRGHTRVKLPCNCPLATCCQKYDGSKLNHKEERGSKRNAELGLLLEARLLLVAGCSLALKPSTEHVPKIPQDPAQYG
jgi:hypothetical protein